MSMYNRDLQRVYAILLLFALGSPWLTPLLSASGPPEAKLPACCRRDGKHGCSMMLKFLASQGKINPSSGKSEVSFSGRKGVCSQFPKGAEAPALDRAGSPERHANCEFIANRQCLIPAAQLESRLHVAFARTLQKRGPPATASL